MKHMKFVVIALTFGILLISGVGLTAHASAQTDPPGASAQAGAAAPTSATTDLKTDACAGLQQLDSTKKCDGSDTGVEKIVKSIVSLLSYLIGIVAVIMVIISGFKYVTASGDPNNVKSAKDTLIYALIGLFIASLAQFLVHFVLRTSNQ
jgi:hypothetical protein